MNLHLRHTFWMHVLVSVLSIAQVEYVILRHSEATVKFSQLLTVPYTNQK